MAAANIVIPNFTDVEKEFLNEKLHGLKSMLMLHATTNVGQINVKFGESFDSMAVSFVEIAKNKTPDVLASDLCKVLGINGFQGLPFIGGPSEARKRIQNYLTAFMVALKLM